MRQRLGQERPCTEKPSRDGFNLIRRVYGDGDSNKLLLYVLLKREKQ